ncbi:hypothetical protein IFM89_027854 [Coptis chinensis]|uniref:DUF913 domain-containing protein n=1 Tax=Coptis chinensis TaxID=261450 RepID=A0A835LSZ9_9MAGN|nr:hypothetical protein IFM89_027854 [Coptis chinensis]
MKALLRAISLGTYAPGARLAYTVHWKSLLPHCLCIIFGRAKDFGGGAVMGGVICSAEVVACIPRCLDALCLNNKGLQIVKDCNALRSFVRIFTSGTIGHGVEAPSLATESIGCSALFQWKPMLRRKYSVSTDDGEFSKMETSKQITEASPRWFLANIESFLPECINNAARLLETILQNLDTCRIFIDKKGIEAVLSCSPCH